MCLNVTVHGQIPPQSVQPASVYKSSLVTLLCSAPIHHAPVKYKTITANHQWNYLTIPPRFPPNAGFVIHSGPSQVG